jgi:hypothetical protein
MVSDGSSITISTLNQKTVSEKELWKAGKKSQ